MQGVEPTALVEGLIPPGLRGVERVPLYTSQVWSVGRRDDRYFAAYPEQSRWHLAVPDARPDLSVNQLQIRVGALGVSVSSQRNASITVDGMVRPSPVVIGAGTAYLSPSTSGLHLDFSVTVLRSDAYPEPDRSIPASGTTLMLKIPIEPGTAPWRVAHALAWPCMPTRRRPHNTGWSGRDVADRLEQLGWTELRSARGGIDITQLGRQLLNLSERVINGKLADERRADQVFAVWPPWLENAEGLEETRDQRAERRNRCVAETLWRAKSVQPNVVDA